MVERGGVRSGETEGGEEAVGMQRLKRRLCILFIFISSRNVNILDRVDAKHRAVEPSLAPLTRPLNHQGRSEDGAVYTYTL